MTVYFAFLLHIYQPPVQIPFVVKKIVKESYGPILDALRENPHARISLNINATLTEQLHDLKFDDIIEGITTLAARGQIDLTGSAKFHPLLPLLPEPEVRRQIKLNEETNRYFFGDVYRPRGFFPPEMAVSEEILGPVKDAGYDWIIMSGIANTLETWPTDFISRAPNGLKLVFRDDIISVDCAFDHINNVETFASRLKYKGTDKDYYVILAMDGETFGHHVPHAIKNFLIPLFESLPRRNDIKIATVSEIVDRFPPGPVQIPRASSWSTMSYDIEHGNPFPLWLDPNNELHRDQYKLIMYAVTMVHLAAKYYPGMEDHRKQIYRNARNFLDRGLYSCQQWWASKRPWYNPDMIVKGISEILLAAINAKRCIPDNAEEIRNAMNLIMEDMLKVHNKIIMELD